MLRAGTAEQWRGSAEVLKDCAELIGATHLAAMNAVQTGDIGNVLVALRYLMIGRVFFFVAGLAIENLVKALLIYRGVVTVGGPTLPAALKGHGITTKLKLLKMTLSPDEAQMVKKFEIAVSWAGRYPVPLDAKRMPAGTGTVTRVQDVADFLTFYNRLDALLQAPAQPPATGNSPDATKETTTS